MRTLLLLLVILPSIALAHNKSDVVEMYNGDRITGEIMGMVNGDLKINPRYSPPINLELQHIASIDSDYNYEILTSNNQRFYGSIASTEKSGEVLFTSIDDSAVIQLLRITEIRPVEESFADRLTYTLGANFTFEPDLLTYKLEGTAVYANRKGQYAARANYLQSTTRTYDEELGWIDGEPSTAALFSIDNEVWTDLKGQRFRSVAAQYDYNDQLNNFGRVSIGAGVGRYWLDNQGVRLATTVGLQGVAEKIKTGDDGPTNLPSVCVDDDSDTDCFDDTLARETLYSGEAFASASLIMYSLTDMDLNLNILGSLYPSLTESDRIRAHLEASLSWEVVSDLFVKLSWYSDFDSGDRDNGGLSPLNTRRLDYNILFGLDWRP